jgi:hypothetical protein
MKIAVLILSTTKEPSTSNVQSMRESFITYCEENKDSLQNEYQFFEYFGVPNNSESEVVKVTDNFSFISLPINDGIYYTFEKTVGAFREVNNIGEFDWFVRLNISSFLNIPVLDKIISMLDTSNIYSSAINSYVSDERYINDIYPRGDFYMFSKNVYKLIEPHFDKYLIDKDNLDNVLSLSVPHVDDCLLGLCIIDGIPQYYDHLHMLAYNFIPRGFSPSNINLYAVSSRVKTLPPDVNYSGYSWEDNEYRRCDGEKMKRLNDLVSKTDFSKITPVFYHTNILIKDSSPNSRPTLFVGMNNQNLSVFRRYIKRKRG